MREVLRHEQHAVIAAGQFHPNPLPVGRRLRANIHDDIVDGTLRASHQLGFGIGRFLVVHAAQCALVFAQGHIGLHHLAHQPMPLELVLAERPGEEAAGITALLQINDVGACQFGFGEDHQTLQKNLSSIWRVRMRYSICLRRVKARKLNISGGMSILLNTS
ncbi:hypothetical protein FQZ97_1050670 [compost metagenome]